MSLDFSEQVTSKSDSELIDIYVNSSDYQTDFVELAKQEISKRNIPLNTINAIKEKKISVDAQALSIGKQGSPVYLAVIGFAALFGGIIAMIGGSIYAYSKHSDVNRNKYFVYNEATRKWRRIMLYVGVGAFLLTWLIKLY